MGTTPIAWVAEIEDGILLSEGHDWNTVVNCEPVATKNRTNGSGCDNCYANTLHTMRHEHYLANDGKWKKSGKPMPKQYAVPFSQVLMLPERLKEPYTWKKPGKCFVCSMGDPGHVDVTDAFLIQMFKVMNETPHIIYQLLTKRPGRFAVGRLPKECVWTPNIWLGTSIEDNDVHRRLEIANKSDAHLIFVSHEPAIGLLNRLNYDLLQWMIMGSESGKLAAVRSMELDWARYVRDECTVRGVPFFLKQIGQPNDKTGQMRKIERPFLDGDRWEQFPQIQRCTTCQAVMACTPAHRPIAHPVCPRGHLQEVAV